MSNHYKMQNGANPTLWFNERAVLSMAHGDHTACVANLSHAIQGFRSSLQHPTQQAQQAQTPQDVQQVSLQSVALPDHQGPSPLHSQFGYNPLMVFNKAFLAAPTKSAALVPSPTTENLIPSVLLYNMALSFHRHGLVVGSTESLTQARDFYQMSMTCLEQHAMVMAQEQHQRLGASNTGHGERLLLAALANNMAHISASFFQIPEAQLSLQLLQDVFVSGPVPFYTVRQQVMAQEDYDIFYMNWMMYQEGAHTALAAAA